MATDDTLAPEPEFPEPGPDNEGHLFQDENGVVWICIRLSTEDEILWGWDLVGE